MGRRRAARRLRASPRVPGPAWTVEATENRTMSFFLKIAPASALAVSLWLSLNAGCVGSTADSDSLGFAAQPVTCLTVTDGQETLPNYHCGNSTASAPASAPSPFGGSLL